MDEIVHLINEIEQRLKNNKELLRRNIFIEIIVFLKEYQLFLVRKLNNRDLFSLIKQIKFYLQQISEQLEMKYLGTSSELYVLIQTFLQLLNAIYSLFSEPEQMKINKFVQGLKTFSMFLLDTSDRRLEDVRSALAKEIEERKKTNKQYKTQFENAKQQLQDAQNLLATKSADILIQNYAQSALEEKERSRYLFWWGISIIFIGILAVSLLFMNCFTEITQSLSWEHFLFKASIFIMFLIPAIYILKESAKRENHYFHLQDLSLKIRTIPNYLKDIPNSSANLLSEKDKVRLELAKIIFSHHITTLSSQNTDNTVEELINLLRLAIKGK